MRTPRATGVAGLAGKLAALALAAILPCRPAQAQSASPDSGRSFLDFVMHPVSGDPIESLTQTDDGFLWLGSHTGLRRFDGLFFRSYDPGTCGPAARLVEAANGNDLWVAHGAGYLNAPLVPGGPLEITLRTGRGGLSLRRAGQVQVVLPCDGSPRHWVWSLLRDRQGDGVWIGSEAGLGRYRDGALTWRRLGDSPAENLVAALGYDGDDGLLVGTAAGLARLDHKHETLTWVKRDEPVMLIAAPRPGAGGAPPSSTDVTRATLWMAGFGPVRSWHRAEADDRAASTTVLDERDLRGLALDLDGTLWAGRSRGLLFAEPDATHFSRPIGTPPLFSVRALFVTRDGSLWAGVKGGGLAQLPGGGIRNLSLPVPGNDDAPMTLLRATDGAIWMAAHANAFRFTHGQWETFAFPERQRWPFSLAETRDGRVLIATTGLFAPGPRGKLDPIALPDLGARTTRAIAGDGQGGIWIAWNEGGLSHYAGADFTRPGRTFELPAPCGSRAHGLYPGRRALLWVLTQGGLVRIDQRSADGAGALNLRCLPTVDESRRPDPARHPTGVLELDAQAGTHADAAWVTTVEAPGLALADANGTVRPLATTGSLHGTLYGITRDAFGHLWLTSPRGVHEIPERELARATRSPSLLSAKTFDVTTGMRSHDCQQTAPIALGDGTVWVATAGGLSVIPRAHRASPAAPLLFDEIVVDGVTHDRPDAILQGNHLQFPSNTRAIEIGYTTPDFLSGGRPVLEHRLNGIDPAWVVADRVRRARYVGLRPGHYTFEVRRTEGALAEPSFDPSTAPAHLRLDFVIQPPFFATLAFRALVGALLLGCAGLAFMLRARRQRDRRRAREDERARIARELHDGLAQGFLSIGFHLDGVQAALPDPDETARLLAQTREVVEAARKEARSAVHALRTHNVERAPQATFEQVLAPLARSLDLDARFRVEGAIPALRPEAAHELSQILREAVTNAVRHGHAREVSVILRKSGDELFLEITDNGVGLQDAPGPESGRTAPAGGGSYGLVGMRERAQALGGTADLHSAPGAWTCVRVRCPLSRVLA